MQPTRQRAIILCIAVALAATVSAVAHEDGGALNVRYLGANGWAVTIGERMLIFDYQEETDPSPARASERDLAHGYIDPAELVGYEVYVFVTHSHFDHYAPVI
jgi:L-ascorbate metabolism protein UlaG (beta-lactamase superfamily)